MKILRIAAAVLSAQFAFVVAAQTTGPGAASSAQKEAPAGKVVVPPVTDPEAVRKAPENVDPEMVSPPKSNGTVQKNVKERAPRNGQRSKDADCKGPATLCKQDSPR